MTNLSISSPLEISQPLNRLDADALDTRLKVLATQSMYCFQAAVSPTDYCFFDINIEQFSDFIQRVEALTPSQRLLLATSLLAEMQLMMGQRQASVRAAA